jgi:hypothetical protein
MLAGQAMNRRMNLMPARGIDVNGMIVGCEIYLACSDVAL